MTLSHLNLRRFGRSALLGAGCLTAAILPAAGLAAGDADIEALRKEIAELRARVERLEGDVASGVAINPARKVQPVPGGWKKPHNWQLLAKGMTETQIIDTLGEPENTRAFGKFAIWTYGSGKVTFYLDRVSSWEQP